MRRERKEEYEVTLHRKFDTICDRYLNNTDRICAAARAKGIADTDSWYIAAVEMAKTELAKERRLQ